MCEARKASRSRPSVNRAAVAVTRSSACVKHSWASAGWRSAACAWPSHSRACQRSEPWSSASVRATARRSGSAVLVAARRAASRARPRRSRLLATFLRRPLAAARASRLVGPVERQRVIGARQRHLSAQQLVPVEVAEAGVLAAVEQGLDLGQPCLGRRRVFRPAGRPWPGSAASSARPRGPTRRCPGARRPGPARPSAAPCSASPSSPWSQPIVLRSLARLRRSPASAAWSRPSWRARRRRLVALPARRARSPSRQHAPV